jgi:crotonobetaine/carnitine-CoA ligase
VVVVPQPGKTVDPKALVEYLIPRTAHFMVPRYVRIVASLPKTPTNKIQKAELRKEGITADTWDRDAAGIVVKRERLRS